NPQQLIGHKKILDHSFYMDASAVDTFQYIYNFSPYPVGFCPQAYLSVAASYWYRVIDGCGVEKHFSQDTLGVSGPIISFGQQPPVVSSSGQKEYAILEKGKHSIHKELSVDFDHIQTGVAGFMALSADSN